MRCSVYIAISLDQFIARLNGELDWLPGSDGQSSGESAEDYGYHTFISSVDTLVMGRNSFDQVLSFGSWPYGNLRVVVLTTRPIDLPESLQKSVELMSGSPQEIVEKLAQSGSKHLYVDGGKTIQSFLASGCIDELILTTIPILIGEGIPLFGAIPHDISLTHLKTTSYPNGMVQSHYLKSGNVAE